MSFNTTSRSQPHNNAGRIETRKQYAGNKYVLYCHDILLFPKYARNTTVIFRILEFCFLLSICYCCTYILSILLYIAFTTRIQTLIFVCHKALDLHLFFQGSDRFAPVTVRSIMIEYQLLEHRAGQTTINFIQLINSDPAVVTLE